MKHLLLILPCLVVVTGCATYAPSNAVRAVEYNPKLKNETVLEAAVDAARESKLPPMSKMDKANGVVEFGGFGMPEMGLSGQARLKPDHYVEITVKRGSMFVPIKADAQANLFYTNLVTRLKEQEAKVQ